MAAYVPSRRGASLRDRAHEISAAGRLARYGNLAGAARALVAAFSPRGPRYLQADGTRTWGSQGRPVSATLQARIDRRMKGGAA